MSEQLQDPCISCPIILKGSRQCDGNPCGSRIEYNTQEHDQQIRAQVLEEVLNIMKEQMGVFESDYNDPDNPNSKPYLDGKINGARIVIMEVEARNRDVEVKNK